MGFRIKFATVWDCVGYCIFNKFFVKCLKLIIQYSFAFLSHIQFIKSECKIFIMFDMKLLSSLFLLQCLHICIHYIYIFCWYKNNILNLRRLLCKHSCGSINITKRYCHELHFNVYMFVCLVVACCHRRDLLASNTKWLEICIYVHHE